MLKDALNGGGFIVPVSFLLQAKVLAEEELTAGKFLTDMSREEIIEILSRSENYLTVSRKLSVGRDYIVWLLNSGYPVNRRIFNSIKCLDVDISDEVRKLYYPNFNTLRMRFTQCVYGSFVPTVAALLWIGVQMDQISDLCESDIQFPPGKMVIVTDSIHIETDDRSIINIVRDYIGCDSREIVSRNGSSKYFPLVTDGHLLKRVEYKNQRREYIPYSQRYLRTQLAEVGLTASYISVSGEFWRLNQGSKLSLDNPTMDYYDRLTFAAWRRAFYE